MQLTDTRSSAPSISIPIYPSPPTRPITFALPLLPFIQAQQSKTWPKCAILLPLAGIALTCPVSLAVFVVLLGPRTKLRYVHRINRSPCPCLRCLYLSVPPKLQACHTHSPQPKPSLHLSNFKHSRYEIRREIVEEWEPQWAWTQDQDYLGRERKQDRPVWYIRRYISGGAEFEHMTTCIRTHRWTHAPVSKRVLVHLFRHISSTHEREYKSSHASRLILSSLAGAFASRFEQDYRGRTAALRLSQPEPKFEFVSFDFGRGDDQGHR